MKHFSLNCAVALGALAYLSAGAQADVTFSYDWSPTVPLVSGDHGFNAIDFSSQGPITVTTNQAVGNVASLSVQNGNSDTFTNSGFNLGVKITDGSNSGTVTFSGQLNGVITNGVPNSLTSTITSPATQTLTLGADQFSVSITGFVPPNAYGAGNKPGGFGFELQIAPSGSGSAPPPNDVPEPTTLLLSCLGVGGFALRGWRMRGKRG
jgi:hypothetical protein